MKSFIKNKLGVGIVVVVMGIGIISFCKADSFEDEQAAKAKYVEQLRQTVANDPRGIVQPDQKQKAGSLSEEEADKRYKACPNGYYTGYRPGKTRYTKDEYLWVVTPAFAKKFCMPPEFVSEELKGAEAVAFKVLENPNNEIICGWGDNAESCSGGVDARFEIYYPTGSVPKRTEGKSVTYYHTANLPSSMMITQSNDQLNSSLEWIEKHGKRPGTIKPFHRQFSIGWLAPSGDKVGTGLTPLYEEIYFEQVFDGVDYLALNGTLMNLKPDKAYQKNYKQFYITADKPEWWKDPNLKKKRIGSIIVEDDRRLDSYAHAIVLPAWYTTKVQLLASGTEDIVSLTKQSLGIDKIKGKNNQGDKK